MSSSFGAGGSVSRVLGSGGVGMDGEVGHVSGEGEVGES